MKKSCFLSIQSDVKERKVLIFSIVVVVFLVNRNVGIVVGMDPCDCVEMANLPHCHCTMSLLKATGHYLDPIHVKKLCVLIIW